MSTNLLSEMYNDSVGMLNERRGEEYLEAADRTWIFTYNTVSMTLEDFYIYYDASNIGKRGKTVTQYRYQLLFPKYQKTAWGYTAYRKLDPKMSYKKMMDTFLGVMEEAAKEEQAELKGPYEWKEKGISKRLPDPSWSEKYEDKSEGNISIRFKKPDVSIYGKKEAEVANTGHMNDYIVIKWTYAKKVNLIANEILKAQTLNNVQKVLDENKVKYDRRMWMQAGWD